MFFDKCSSSTRVITGLLFLLIPIVAIGLFINYFGIGHAKSIADWGSTGDFFGGILNPVFSFVTIILLLISIRLQLNELSLTRHELKLTRVEHSKSREAQEEHQKNSKELLKREEKNQLLKLIDSEDRKIESCLDWKYSSNVSLGDLNNESFKSALNDKYSIGVKLRAKVYLLENAYVNKLKAVTLFAQSNKGEFTDYLIETSIDQLHFLFNFKPYFHQGERASWLVDILSKLLECTGKPYYKKEIINFIEALNKINS